MVDEARFLRKNGLADAGNYSMIDRPRAVLPDFLNGVEVTHDHLLAERVKSLWNSYRVGSDAVLVAASLTAGGEFLILVPVLGD